jgi:tetratricopeptide (TPR) repeat protein
VLAGLWPAALPAQVAAPDPSTAAEIQLGFAEQLYREGDRFRAESELLRFAHDFPADPRRGAAELARAKLYYQEGRYREASLMLHSLLDRFPRDEAASPATRLLLLSEVQSGDFEGAGQTLRRSGTLAGEAATLAALRQPAPDAVDPGTAVAWSTVLPGTGFFLLDQPAKAATALTLNVAFLAGTVIAYRQRNYGAALVMALVEIALYGGQREAVRQEAESILARQDRERREAWAQTHGEKELLAVGIELKFGGK